MEEILMPEPLPAISRSNFGLKKSGIDEDEGFASTMEEIGSQTNEEPEESCLKKMREGQDPPIEDPMAHESPFIHPGYEKKNQQEGMKSSEAESGLKDWDLRANPSRGTPPHQSPQTINSMNQRLAHSLPNLQLMKPLINQSETVPHIIRFAMPGLEEGGSLIQSVSEKMSLKNALHPDLSQNIAKAGVYQSLVRSHLENNLQQIKSLFSSHNNEPSNVTMLLNDGLTSNMGDPSQNLFSSFMSGTGGMKVPFAQIASQMDLSNPMAEALISERYGIQNLHHHILDQIRIAMDPGKNEAKIRLHPPELGDIRIHLVMEDRNLTVRMEVSETMVRHMLERDLQQLKNTLTDAGIDVNRFDIHSGSDQSRANREEVGKKSFSHQVEGEAKEINEKDKQEVPQGAVNLGPNTQGIDYLVY